MGGFLAVVGVTLLCLGIGSQIYRRVGPSRRRRADYDRRARLGPNLPDVPVDSFKVRARIDDPSITLRGGDLATLYVSANHIGVTSHGILDRVLVYDRDEAPTIVLAGTTNPKQELRIYGSHGHASLLMFGQTRTSVARSLTRYEWPHDVMSS